MVSTYLNTKGSVWRKWDLHIHTPETRLNDGFRGGWEPYIQEIEKSDVSVIGVTDYLSVKNYFKIKNYKQNENRLGNIQLILPNVELRLQDSTERERGINYHVIFSPEIDSYIESHFLSKLTFEYGDRNYNATDRDLMELGRSFGATISDEAALVEGIKQFKVNVNQINNILEVEQQQIFKGKYVTAVANKETDGASGIRDNQFKGVKQNIYQKSQMIFSSRPKDRDFFLEENSDLRCPKPCVHGSDAHKLETLFKPDGERYTWIKADPTFEGLLQILTEPERRVRIQKDYPEIKMNYNVIDKVLFKDTSGDFQTHEIHLNSGLNTIIGGKSSGKSLLLYKIATTVSPEEINLRTKDEIWTNNYKDSFIDQIEFEVHWKNGNIANSKTATHIGNITYIPQLYINSLSEDTKNEVLQEKIWDILKSDAVINDKMKKSLELEASFKAFINNTSFKLATELNSYNDLILKIKKYQKLENYLEEKDILTFELQKELDESKMTPEDELLHHQLNTQAVSLKGQITEEEKTLTDLDIINTMIYSILSLINNNFDSLMLNKDESRTLVTSYRLKINELIQTMLKELKEKIEVISKNESNSQATLIDITQKIKIIESKYTREVKISELREKIQLNEKNILELTELKTNEAQILTNINNLKWDLLDNLGEVFDNQKDLVGLLSNKEIGSLKVRANLSFNQKEFQDIFIENFNLRKSLSMSIPEGIIDGERNFLFDKENYISKVEEILKTILQLPVDRFKQNFNLSRVIEDTFRIYTKVILDIEKDHDTISVMSPGKRGLVLLELFLSISDEKHPILIDQPEDNLDNRTISTELVNFVREKSKERQIIIVTHNANIVVLTDSENVVVASQDPTIIENAAHRFEYLTGSLECSFMIEGNEKLYARGIRNHACDILEGGPDAFALRELKYGFK